jgi:nicotinate-nucleotide adenylyltransferase
MKRLGILGGTFNPIHNGHLRIAELAYTQLSLGEILLIPSGRSYMKDDTEVLDKHHRLAMVKLAARHYPYLRVSEVDLDRPGDTYTCDTIAELRMLHPRVDLYFIIGADTIFLMEDWKKPEYIFQNAVIAVVLRDEISKDDLNGHAEYLKKKYDADIRMMSGGKIDISSHQIRELVKQGESIFDIVPDDVAEYIRQEGLYEARPD